MSSWLKTGKESAALQKQEEAAINLKKIVPKRVTPKEDFKKLRDRTLVQNIYGKSKNPRRIYRGKGLS